MQDGALIIDVGDSDTDCLKLMALGTYLIEELLDFTVPGTLHIDKHLVEISLGVLTFG